MAPAARGRGRGVRACVRASSPQPVCPPRAGDFHARADVQPQLLLRWFTTTRSLSQNEPRSRTDCLVLTAGEAAGGFWGAPWCDVAVPYGVVSVQRVYRGACGVARTEAGRGRTRRDEAGPALSPAGRRGWTQAELPGVWDGTGLHGPPRGAGGPGPCSALCESEM